jgi:hypothetical protein
MVIAWSACHQSTELDLKLPIFKLAAFVLAWAVNDDHLPLRHIQLSLMQRERFKARAAGLAVF